MVSVYKIARKVFDMVLSMDFSSCFCGVVVWCCDRVACSVSVDCFVLLFLCYGMSFTENNLFGDCAVLVQLLSSVC